MAVTPARVVLFLIGLFLVGGLIAYGTGAFDTQPDQPQTASAPIAAAPASTPATPEPERVAQPQTEAAIPSSVTGEPDAATAQQEATASVGEPAADAATSTRSGRVTPSFDILRVESDGSTVIAGRAKPGADVEIVSDDMVLGQTKVSPNGDFAIALDTPLTAGDHTLGLRAKDGGGSASSTEMAIVSVPSDKKGQVLAMVQEPGQPSRLISLPHADDANKAAASASETAAAPSQDEEAPAATTEPAPNKQTAAVNTDKQAPAAAPQAAETSAAPTVEAVEIEGSMIYVAGRSAPGTRLRAYANDDFLGEAKASPDGQFLVEAKRDLAVGKYTIRIDAIGADGATVTQRAAVPFEREAGEAVAAVAPKQDDAGADASATASASTQPPAASAAPTAPANESAAASVAATAPALQAAKGAVIIRRGDSLWRISKRAYGRGVRYSTIYLANQDQIQNPDRIWPGQVFHMPDSTKEGEKADMTQLGDQATTRD
ncbi:LysM peptidoglycan-binding domain-containing protein [Tianweitania sp. BSSL-BM11]|uniref:LysM peptidoglycan-binding domain-containing protein n=1 Tax=Tianweitania aestuarii TaxID=2814886 RepID=A0ABS5RSD6_9HYPH|nr:Ig-like domain-containing protein [Tianweitania aestuarii]MBS9719965.1 LysM peptidoglycan-binding domain-containing protein [Tianweitania aestuarii]